MKRDIFDVTYDIVTPESAKIGDSAARGFAADSVSLRDAVMALHQTRTSAVDGVSAIECDSLPCTHPRWVSIVNGTEFKTGAVETRSLHIPCTLSAHTARRIARLLGAKLS